MMLLHGRLYLSVGSGLQATHPTLTPLRDGQDRLPKPSTPRSFAATISRAWTHHWSQLQQKRAYTRRFPLKRINNSMKSALEADGKSRNLQHPVRTRVPPTDVREQVRVWFPGFQSCV